MTGIRLKFTAKERDLIKSNILDESGVSDSLDKVGPRNGRWEVRCTLDDLDHLLGSIAAEANHCKAKKRQKDLDALYERLAEIEDKHHDAP